LWFRWHAILMAFVLGNVAFFRVAEMFGFMKSRREKLRDASEKPDSSRLPKLPARGRKRYDLSSEEIEALLISEDTDA